MKSPNKNGTDRLGPLNKLEVTQVKTNTVIGRKGGELNWEVEVDIHTTVHK